MWCQVPKRWQRASCIQAASIFIVWNSASGASQPAGQVGLVVGNMHICGGKEAPELGTREDCVQQALRLLERVEVDSWRHRENFQVVRVLVGAFVASQRQPTNEWGRQFREEKTLRLGLGHD